MSTPNYQAILKTQYNVLAKSVTPFKNNVALIELENGQQAIFKRARTEMGGSLIDRFRFRNEIRMYKAFEKMNFTFLHVPKMYSAGKDHILIEFVERNENKNVIEQDFAKAYYEMQNLKIPPSLKFDIFNQLTRGVWYRGLVVPILTLRKHIGINEALKVASLFFRLHSQTKRFKNRYWLHGDLAVRNIYYHLQSDKTYFIDFENVYYTSKWPLLEILQRCFCYEGDAMMTFRFDFEVLNQYLLEAKENQDKELFDCNLHNQLRLSLLIRATSMIIRPKTKSKTAAYKTLLNVILYDNSYQSFFQLQLAPLLKKSANSGISIPIDELKRYLS